MANETRQDQTESDIVIYLRCGWVIFLPVICPKVTWKGLPKRVIVPYVHHNRSL